MQQKSTLTRFQVEGDAAADYQRFLVPAIFERWAAMLIGVADLQEGDRVLDLACGTGVVARTAATRVGPTGRVVGVDVNDAMLTVARGSGSEVDYQSADATELPFADAAFDAVVCQQGLQFFPDRLGALQQVRRVLDRGGQATVAVWRSIDHSPVFAEFADALQRHAGPGAGTVMRSPFQLGAQDEVRALFAEAEFRDIRVEIQIAPVRFPSAAEMFEAEVRSSPLAEIVPSVDEDAIALLVEELEATLASHQDDDGVVFPLESHVIVARP